MDRWHARDVLLENHRGQVKVKVNDGVNVHVAVKLNVGVDVEVIVKFGPLQAPYLLGLRWLRSSTSGGEAPQGISEGAVAPECFRWSVAVDMSRSGLRF